MQVSTYDKGDVLRITGTYANAAGTNIDPSTPKFTLKDPSGIDTTYTYPTNAQLVRLSTGVYYCDVRFINSGPWYARHWSTGTGEASAEKEYYVKQGAF